MKRLVRLIPGRNVPGDSMTDVLDLVSLRKFAFLGNAYIG